MNLDKALLWIWINSNLFFGNEFIKIITQGAFIVLGTGLAIKLNNRNNRQQNQKSLKKYLSYLYFEAIENCVTVDDILKTFNYHQVLDARLWSMYEEKIKDQGPLSVFYLTKIYKEIGNYHDLRQFHFRKSELEEIEESSKEIQECLKRIKLACKTYLKMIDEAPNMEEPMKEAKKRYKEITDLDSSIMNYMPKHSPE